ncbi:MULTISPECIES: carboxyl-terminal processing protease CtpB [Planktothrix]|jgi:carboxyl-terminal processing protease|uniref:Carboxyl-terminal processing protease n=2 Tax=Planktothrix TaxID=54304 RepID=A0A4P5ZAQ4_PLAAG|nr:MULTISPECIES: carboxyl-terminal processing protease CtpB [Planktothrix]CAD5979313.1 Carboxyl-terminal-processing protease [Planktothrix rubescens]CAC5345143.1 c-terminal processing protease [Planktothrix rubescens NIVA-CYA 18]CAD0232223.1 Carboxyl-terminal protease [Planktothrix agardhii]CAD5929150.1 Carboxyl-terminal-processing protease [Planktothrix agardhii]CAD5963570.1 Carboxyl-terminal-processing protease [Planktothrix rubescens NIVA-CYA 18]
MNQNVKRFSPLRQALFTGAIAAVTAFVMPAWSSSVSAPLKDSPKAVLDEAWQLVFREFVDGKFNQVNWQAQREELLSKNYTSREEAYTALRKALEKLQDPYTRFMDPKQYEALTNQTAGELSGVGMQLTLDETTKAITVVEPIKNSPAIKAGIQSGDRVLAIDGVSTTGMTVEQAANKIRGSVGTNVNLRMGREGEKEFDLTLTRARIELETVTYRVNNEGNRKIGYIQLREFNSHAAEQMQAAIQALTKENVQAFVLDLRGNPGGLLRTSIDIARMWMDTGAIVSTVDRNGKTQEIRNNRTSITKLPVVVLVDSNSASASEILAGALKDNQRGVVMGTQTFGKALVQSVFSLSDGSGLAVTIAHYYTPNGIDISHKGVTPDVKVDISDDQKKQLATDPKLIGTPQDPFYAKAISILAGLGGNRPLAINESK